MWERSAIAVDVVLGAVPRDRVCVKRNRFCNKTVTSDSAEALTD